MGTRLNMRCGGRDLFVEHANIR
ncbi:hypothetical protein POVCU1_027880, partial [Plasmodium ovale curtisi]